MRILFLVLLVLLSSLKLKSELSDDDRVLITTINSFVVLNNGNILLTTKNKELYKATSIVDTFALMDYIVDPIIENNFRQSINIKKIGSDTLLLRNSIVYDRSTIRNSFYISLDYGDSWEQFDNSNSIGDWNNRKLENFVDSNQIISNNYSYDNLADTTLGALYFLQKENSVLYKCTRNKIDSIALYTNSKKISKPKNIYIKNVIYWGFEGRHLYYSHINDTNWYRQKKFDFSINNLNFIGNDSIIITDYKYDNHVYSIKSEEINNYNYKSNSINDFFEYDITNIHVESGNSGGMSSCKSEVIFELTNEDLVSETVYIEEHYKDLYTLSQLIKVTPDTVKKAILNSFNNRDFTFDIRSLKDSSFKSYFVEFRKSLYEKHYIRNEYKTEEYTKETNDFIEQLDTLSQETIDELVYEYVEPSPLLSMWFIATFENSNGDTLIVRTTNQSTHNPFNLPWIIKYNGLIEKTYNHKLSAFFNHLVPNEFYSRSYGKKEALIKIYNKLKTVRKNKIED